MESPLTGNWAQLERKIDSTKIIEAYKNTFGYDVSYLLNEIKQIEVYKCFDTGYRFFYPFNISGDSSFYEYLQQYDWYYMPWKWEHEQASKIISNKMKVLEVGCAKGDFLMKIKERFNAECVGLEFNENAISIARQKGLNVLSESIEQHSLKNKNEYNVVCSFQVLEHISNVKSFIESKILCLKKNGFLIISVPNNDSFLDKSYNILNMPPHHMGLWNKQSLSSIAKIYGLQIIDVFFEPLQEYHRDYFNNTNANILKSNIFFPQRLYKKISPLINFFLTKSYKAFTIQVIYKKL